MVQSLILIPIVVLILGLHHFLSTRKRAWPGTIFPIIYVIVIGGQLIAKVVEIKSSRDIFFYILGFVIFTGIWIEGRDSVKKKRQKELDKMKSHDMQ
ncbi:hypothetical protein GCM10007063_34220 [Lentibacillus kapialis]|uniref:Uncharacterized protein n=1 Tax=Lentibacillus kapialis TaxID=340214 RepID=A0A917V1M6_9BACI|nr:hypothetical protein [Lentibacillus kapialis]GGK08925.1 hypothetical protein GCM10007063_34220 [Lentibacillus kapialis]